jgi:hypothetical protein
LSAWAAADVMGELFFFGERGPRPSLKTKLEKFPRHFRANCPMGFGALTTA